MKRLRTHPLYYKFRLGLRQFIIPFIVFQLIRTILFPTGIDVVILLLFIGIFAALELDWI